MAILDLLLNAPDGSHVHLSIPDPFSFVVLGDPHPGKLPIEHPWSPSPVLKKIIPEVNQLQPALVLTVGDLIQGYTRDEEMLTRQHQAIRDELSKLSAPFLPCIGNHDVREEVSERIWRKLWGPRYYSFEAADCHFTILDAELNKDLESIAGIQLEWLRRDLLEAGDKRIFVLGHRPYWKDYPLHQATWKGPGGRNYWTEDVESLLAGKNVAAVIVGHQHKYEQERIGGIPHIITGGAGGDVMDTPASEGGIAHYLWVRVDQNGCRFEVRQPVL